MRRFLSTFLAVALSFSAMAQQAAGDSLVRLVSAHRAEQMTLFGTNYRIVKGDATFLHNNTYLLCDSASWNVDTKIIEAFGNVRVLQDRTQLTSEQMVYSIDENTARFKGGVVQLDDKDGNTLRTTQLNYNTKDSVATFMYGGAMKDSSGNVIESVRGSYDSKIKTFTFEDRVELYMDTVYLKSEELRYVSDEEKAHFGKSTYTWRGDGFIKSDGGWYGRRDSTIYFCDDVYMNDPSYEAWAQEVYYYQPRQDVDMYKKVKILDTADRTIFLADHVRYQRDSSRAWLTRNPAMVYVGKNENGELDTLFLRADTLFAHQHIKGNFSDKEITDAEKRKADAQFDAINQYRTQKAEERAKGREDKLRAAGKLPPVGKGAAKDSVPDKSSAGPSAPPVLSSAMPAPHDTLAAALQDSTLSLDSMIDSLPPATPDLQRDTTASAMDTTVVEVVDSTLISCVEAYHNVRIYRSDVQAVCDSLSYSDLDSMARMFGAPALWNAVKNQLTAETMQILLKDGNLYRGNMITDARITSMEDSLHFNQIKGTEMVGYFYDNELYRFDALGGAAAVFNMVEEGRITTVNIKEAKSLTALIKDGNARRMLYFDAVKSDAYPLLQLEPEKQRLKGFVWRPDERPVDRFDITEESVPTSERQLYSNVRMPRYIETDKYFDNYMTKLQRKMEQDREAERLRRIEKQRIEDSIAFAEKLLLDSIVPLDSITFADTMSVRDTILSINKKEEQVVDIVVNTPPADSGDFTLPVFPNADAFSTLNEKPSATVGTSEQVTMTKAQLRAQRRAERKALREQRRAERQKHRFERRQQRLERRSARRNHK